MQKFGVSTVRYSSSTVSRLRRLHVDHGTTSAGPVSPPGNLRSGCPARLSGSAPGSCGYKVHTKAPAASFMLAYGGQDVAWAYDQRGRWSSRQACGPGRRTRHRPPRRRPTTARLAVGFRGRCRNRRLVGSLGHPTITSDAQGARREGQDGQEDRGEQEEGKRNSAIVLPGVAPAAVGYRPNRGLERLRPAPGPHQPGRPEGRHAAHRLNAGPLNYLHGVDPTARRRPPTHAAGRCPGPELPLRAHAGGARRASAPRGAQAPDRAGGQPDVPRRLHPSHPDRISAGIRRDARRAQQHVRGDGARHLLPRRSRRAQVPLRACGVHHAPCRDDADSGQLRACLHDPRPRLEESTRPPPGGARILHRCATAAGRLDRRHEPE